MKIKGLYIYCAFLTAAVAFAIGARFVSKPWFETTFKSVGEIIMAEGGEETAFPLIERTAVRFKTSDSSYVLISRCRLIDLENFYRERKCEVEKAQDGMIVTFEGREYEIERLADELGYVSWGVRGVS